LRFESFAKPNTIGFVSQRLMRTLTLACLFGAFSVSATADVIVGTATNSSGFPFGCSTFDGTYGLVAAFQKAVREPSLLSLLALGVISVAVTRKTVPRRNPRGM
jgi:hypothetical protein